MAHNIRMYHRSAKELGFDTELSEGNDFFMIKTFRENVYFIGTTPPFNSVSNAMVATHKYMMNFILADRGFPVPKASIVPQPKPGEEVPESVWQTIRETLTYPLVAKPAHGTSAGRSVLCHITNEIALKAHVFKCLDKNKSSVSVEEYCGGFRCFRVLLLDHKVIGVVERFPAAVIGDGQKSLQALVDEENVRRKTFLELSQGSIELDAETDFKLETLHMTLDYVPKKDEKVELCFSCNSTRGGTMRALRKNHIHKKNAALLSRASRALGLRMVGFDVNCVDILEPITKETGVIIEANHHPDVSIHENPMFGDPQRVTKLVMRRVARQYPFTFVWGYYKKHKKGWGLFAGKVAVLVAAALALHHYVKF